MHILYWVEQYSLLVDIILGSQEDEHQNRISKLFLIKRKKNRRKNCNRQN